MSGDPIGWLHGRMVFGRRVAVLARHVAALLPRHAAVLDIGCGDGSIAARIGELRPDVRIEGIDVLVRADTKIPAQEFDGRSIPFPDDAFDSVLLLDVLHHADDQMRLLAEACRVARQSIVIKDHYSDGPVDEITLRAMDWVGNARHGVALPYKYWSREAWARAFAELDLRPARAIERLGLYPAPASLVFERGLHFIAALEPSRGTGAT